MSSYSVSNLMKGHMETLAAEGKELTEEILPNLETLK